MTVTVKILKEIPRRTTALKAGSVVETSKDIADKWIADGLAENLIETKKPIDIPKALAKAKEADTK